MVMVVQITTWSPDTCSCEVSFTWDDSVPSELRVSTFYALHNVCPHHAHLATRDEHLAKSAERDLHRTKGQVKMRHVHTAMERNVTQHQNALARVTRRIHRQDLEALTPTIHQHNQKVQATFEDIFDQPFAHDEHIYKAVLAENQLKNRALGHIKETHDIDADWEFNAERQLVLKVDGHKVADANKTLRATFPEHKINITAKTIISP